MTSAELADFRLACSMDREDRADEGHGAEPPNPSPLTGRWRHANGTIFCGTLRIAKADFDTNPSDEFQKELFDAICAAMNQKTP